MQNGVLSNKYWWNLPGVKVNACVTNQVPFVNESLPFTKSNVLRWLASWNRPVLWRPVILQTHLIRLGNTYNGYTSHKTIFASETAKLILISYFWSAYSRTFIHYLIMRIASNNITSVYDYTWKIYDIYTRTITDSQGRYLVCNYII